MSEIRQRYVIHIANVLAPRWISYFELEESNGSLVQGREGAPGTRIIVSVVDQTELISMVNILHDFGMQIESVTRLQSADADVAFRADQDLSASQQQ